MRRIKEEVHVVFITQIGGEDGCIEVGGTLIAIVASGIRVVEVEAYVEALVGIDGKLGIDVILAVGLITTVVVENVGIGREGVHEEELLGPFLHKAVGLRKDEDIVDDRTIDEDSAQARCVVVTRSVVLAIGTCVEGGVHEEVRHRVRHCWDHIAKLLVDGPHIDTLGNHLVLRRVVVVLIEFRVVAALGHVTHLVNLVKRVLGTDRCQRQQCNEKQTQSFSHSVI